MKKLKALWLVLFLIVWATLESVNTVFILSFVAWMVLSFYMAYRLDKESVKWIKN